MSGTVQARREAMESAIKRVSGLNEYRCLANAHEKAAYLVLRERTTPALVAEHLGMSLSAMDRAVLAAKNKRGPGKNGRPYLLLDSDENALCAWLLEREQARNRAT